MLVFSSLFGVCDTPHLRQEEQILLIISSILSRVAVRGGFSAIEFKQLATTTAENLVFYGIFNTHQSDSVAGRFSRKLGTRKKLDIIKKKDISSYSGWFSDTGEKCITNTQVVLVLQ